VDQLPARLGSAKVMLDCELVAPNASGVPSFSGLQLRMHV